jgi:large subunit ribosomal protein L25
MKTQELQVQLREETGKGVSRKLRGKELVPAVFYGPYVEKPVSLAVNLAELRKLRAAGGSVFFTLRASGSPAVDGKLAVVKDEQIHPLSGKFLHVDLLEVRMDEEIKVSVPIALTGKPAGAADGGILQVVRRELEVRCLPTNVPAKIEVDVSALMIGDSIHVSEIKLPDGVKATSAVNYTIAALVPPEEEVVAAAPVAADAVISETGQPVEGAAPAEGAAAAKGAAPAAPGAAPAKGAEKAPAGKEGGEKKAEGKKPEGK